MNDVRRLGEIALLNGTVCECEGRDFPFDEGYRRFIDAGEGRALLGPYPTLVLKDARERRSEALALIRANKRRPTP